MDTQITVNRTSEKDVQHRQIIMSIDGEPLGTLMFGQSITTAIAPGPHKIKAYNTLVWKTIDFELQEGEHATFSVVNVPGKWSFSLLALLGAGPLYGHGFSRGRHRPLAADARGRACARSARGC